MHVYEGRPRKDHRGIDLISDALPFGRLWYEDASAAAQSHQGTACPKCRLSARGNARQRVRRAGLYVVWRARASEAASESGSPLVQADQSTLRWLCPFRLHFFSHEIKLRSTTEIDLLLLMEAKLHQGGHTSISEGLR